MRLIPTSKQHSTREDGDREYIDYVSKTKLGSRYDTIVALYGSINIWTLYCYWWKDSIVKQTIMLADKTGMRRREDMIPVVLKFKSTITDEELNKRLGIIFEDETQKVERIRQKHFNPK